MVDNDERAKCMYLEASRIKGQMFYVHTPKIYDTRR